MIRSSGFTLVELLLVAALLGLIAVIAAPRIPNTDREEKARAESFLLETFRTARQEALRSQATCGVRVDTGARRVSFYRYDTKASRLSDRRITQDDADTACLLHPVTRAPFVQNYGSGTDYPRLDLQWENAGFWGGGGMWDASAPQGDVQFDAHGMPWVFDSRNGIFREPVPLTLRYDGNGQGISTGLRYVVGAASGVLTVCFFTGRVIANNNSNANDACNF